MTIRDWNFALEAPDDKDWEAYVGLREKNSVVTLRVPHGYPLTATDKPQILGELMRAVARFSDKFPKAGHSERDGLLKSDHGLSFEFDNDGAALGHTHLSNYIRLIRILRDPRLLAITKAPGLTAQFDHRHMARNLERAMYMPDGTPIFEQSWAQRTQMRHTNNDMVGLACWIALDGLKHLFPDSAEHKVGSALQSEWEELAHRFDDEHELDADATLFSDKRNGTLRALQAGLEICVRTAPPVSSDARELHHLLDELLHRTLSGQNGENWGLKGFHRVWESACLEQAVRQYGIENVLTCDDEYLPDVDSVIRNRWQDYRREVFAKNGLARRPDLVLKKPDDTCLIIDFKYYAENDAVKFTGDCRPSSPDFKLCKEDPDDFCRNLKTYQDISSIEAYRWLMMQHEPDASVQLELWIPGKNKKTVALDWQAKEYNESLGETTRFDNLSLVYQPAREIISAYAERFSLMD